MSTIVLDEKIRIPASIVDLESFRHWARSDAYPDHGRFSHLKGELWVDLMPEQLFTHNQVKGECAIVLGGMLKSVRLGRYFHDRTLLTNLQAELSTEPDGTFVSYDALEEGRVRLVEGGEGFVELEGAPDMVLEVVSATSVQKDTVVLLELYWEAGIPEYWLIDARSDRLRFERFRRGATSYVPVQQRAGWAESAVFGKSFRLTSAADELGNPEYALAVR